MSEAEDTAGEVAPAPHPSSLRLVASSETFWPVRSGQPERWEVTGYLSPDDGPEDGSADVRLGAVVIWQVGVASGQAAIEDVVSQCDFLDEDLGWLAANLFGDRPFDEGGHPGWLNDRLREQLGAPVALEALIDSLREQLDDRRTDGVEAPDAGDWAKANLGIPELVLASLSLQVFMVTDVEMEPAWASSPAHEALLSTCAAAWLCGTGPALAAIPCTPHGESTPADQQAATALRAEQLERAGWETYRADILVWLPVHRVELPGLIATTLR